DLFATAVETRGREVNVIRLPRERRQAHIHERRVLRVEAAAFVVLALEAEAVEDLEFVAVLHVDAAVGPALPAGVRHERQEELQVNLVVLESLLADDAVIEEVPLD